MSQSSDSTNIDLGLTAEAQQQIAVSYLRDLAEQKPDMLPYDLFLQMSRLMVMTTVEVGFVRPSEEEDTMDVILTRRSAKDKHWANLWHIPGSVARPNDPVSHEHDHDAAISRVLDEVGGSVQIIGEPHVYDTTRHQGSRGSETTIHLIAEVDGEPSKGKFYNSSHVLRTQPDFMIRSHLPKIASLDRAYRTLKTQDN